MQETRVRSLGWEDPLEKEVATHSSILAWKIPWTEEPGRPQAMGLQELDMTEWLNHQPPKVKWSLKTSLPWSCPNDTTYCFIPFIHDMNPHMFYKCCSLNTRYSTFTSLSCFPAWITGCSPRQLPLLVKITHMGEKAYACEQHDKSFQ